MELRTSTFKYGESPKCLSRLTEKSNKNHILKLLSNYLPIQLHKHFLSSRNRTSIFVIKATEYKRWNFMGCVKLCLIYTYSNIKVTEKLKLEK